MLASPVDAASSLWRTLKRRARCGGIKQARKKLKKKHTSLIADFKKRDGHFGARLRVCFQMTVVFA
jgi:hypothetical protein